MLELDATEATLRRFEEQVIGKSKLNLKRKNKLSSKRLFNSIDGELKVFPNSFQLSFFMEDYWQFVDYGVKGVGGTKADGSKWTPIRSLNGPKSIGRPYTQYLRKLDKTRFPNHDGKKYFSGHQKCATFCHAKFQILAVAQKLDFLNLSL